MVTAQTLLMLRLDDAKTSFQSFEFLLFAARSRISSAEGSGFLSFMRRSRGSGLGCGGIGTWDLGQKSLRATKISLSPKIEDIRFDMSVSCKK